MTADSLQKQIEGLGGSQGEGQKGWLFQKGRSGNPAGRQPGSRNRATLAAELLLAGEAEVLTRKVIELALEGDITALRLCLERIVPPRRSRALTFKLAPIDRIEDLAGAIGSILQEVANGRLLLDEAAALVGLLEAKRKAMETIDVENRLRALEAESTDHKG